MTRVRSIVITAGAVLAVALCGCGNGPPEVAAGGGGPAVGTSAPSGLGAAATKITANSSNQFSPGTSAAATGQVVQWTVASDSVPHNITFDQNPELSSPASLGPGETWQVKFSVAGTYAYHCTIHSGMNGQLTVSQGSGSGASGSSSSGASTSASASPSP